MGAGPEGRKKGRGACGLGFDVAHPPTCNYPVTHTGYVNDMSIRLLHLPNYEVFYS